MLECLEGCILYGFFFFFNDTATTEIYTLSLHDALPILLVSLWGALLVTAWGVATAAFWRWLGSPPHQQSQPARALTAWERIFWATTLWCVMETLGNWTPLWWTALGLTQSPHNLPLLHWGQVSGPITIAAILVLINGCITEAFTVDARGKSGARSGTQAWVVGAIALVLVAEITGLFAYSQPLGDSPDDAIDVGIIQIGRAHV